MAEHTRPRARWSLPLALLVLAAFAAGAWHARDHWLPNAEASTATAPVTAPVELTTLTSQLRLNAQLSHGEAVPLPATAGMITALPTVGETIAVGQQVLEVDGRPVILLRGERPFWRELALNSAGDDVSQLQENLANLGFYDGAADGKLGPATRAALRAWQKSLGVAQTGIFSPSDAVVTPAPSIMIASIGARLGERDVSPGGYTSTLISAKAVLTEAQARELSVGTPVTVQLPNGTEIPAELSSIDPGGQTLPDGGAASPSALIEFSDQAPLAEVGTVSVRVIVSDESTQTPTLVVPATSLIATANGGYAVEIYEGQKIVRVPVEIGLVADARVQILRSGREVDGGDGRPLAEGDQVVLAR